MWSPDEESLTSRGGRKEGRRGEVGQTMSSSQRDKKDHEHCSVHESFFIFCPKGVFFPNGSVTQNSDTLIQKYASFVFSL